MGLGDGLTAGRSDPPDEAVGYYGSGAKAYATILKRIKEKDAELNAPAGAETTIMVRLAACLRKLGKYEDSKKALLKILREREK